MAQFFGWVAGFGVVIVFWLGYRILSGNWNLTKLWEGHDGRPSTSKLQFVLWTLVVFFAYGAVWGARASEGDFEVISEIPQNLLIAMGISVTTLAGAKGITVAYVNRGLVTKDKVKPSAEESGIFVKDDVKDNVREVDLSKIQMMGWTFFALFVYLIRLWQQVGTVSLPVLPDIDAALMVLMGLGQGAYLGKKLGTVRTASKPQLTGLSPGSGRAGADVTITGLAFGEEQDGSQITFDKKPLDVSPTWKNEKITFAFPAQKPDNTSWSAGEKVEIGLTVGSEESNVLPFVVTV